jgi:hypothetical protein
MKWQNEWFLGSGEQQLEERFEREQLRRAAVTSSRKWLLRIVSY